MSENLDREAIVKALKDEALHETGWLSDLHRQGLEWHDASEIIVIDDWFGSVDVGHLAEVVERLIAAATEERASRLEQAEQAVSRVRDMADEMGEGKAFGILTRGREDEYPISYFIEMLEEALDGEQE